jgi:hypothetical protein
MSVSSEKRMNAKNSALRCNVGFDGEVSKRLKDVKASVSSLLGRIPSASLVCRCAIWGLSERIRRGGVGEVRSIASHMRLLSKRGRV